MSNFKVKKEKKIKIKHNRIKNHSTLDKKHQEKCKKFEKNKSHQNDLSQQLILLKSELEVLNKSITFNNEEIEKKKRTY